MKNPVVKLNVFGMEYEGGIKFEIVHDLNPDLFGRLHDEWYSMPLPFGEESLILFVKLCRPDCICVTKADYEKVTKGKAVKATKEEWEAENN